MGIGRTEFYGILRNFTEFYGISGGAMKLIDRFTTQDGEWYVSGKPYSITKEAAEKYGAEASQLGGANHIYVKVDLASVVRVYTIDGGNVSNPSTYYASPGSWVNHPLFHSSSYKPSNGETGPWFVEVDGEVVVAGIGLPNGWHVSTYLVVGEGSEDTGNLPVPPHVGDHYQLYRNGDLVWENQSGSKV